MTLYNFAPGPSVLAPAVKEKLAAMVLDWADGLSLAEYPHRSPAFEALLEQTRQGVRRLLNISEDYEVLFLMGGARQQFDWIARNFLKKGALYWVSGHWSKMAAEMAKPFGEVTSFETINETTDATHADYAFVCVNETIDGIEFHHLPKLSVPWVVDASSNIFSRPMDMTGVGLLMAGAQKNAGIAGVTIVVIHKDFLAKADVGEKDRLYSYKAHAKAGSMLVTPPTLAIGAVRCVLDWIEEMGGIEAMEKVNSQKATLIYKTIDESNGFYRPRVEGENRSRMNVVFDLPNETLLEEFLKGAQERGLLNLRGHRSAGGIRASIYNAMPIEGVKALVDWMKTFQTKWAEK